MELWGTQDKDTTPVTFRGVSASEWALSIITTVWLFFGLLMIVASIVIPDKFLFNVIIYTLVAAVMFVAMFIMSRQRRKAYQGHPIEVACKTKSGRTYLNRVRIMLIATVILSFLDFGLLVYFDSLLVNG